jgi:hypothetical protein
MVKIEFDPVGWDTGVIVYSALPVFTAIGGTLCCSSL